MMIVVKNRIDIGVSGCIMGCQPITTSLNIFNRLASDIIKSFKACYPLTQPSLCARYVHISAFPPPISALL